MDEKLKEACLKAADYIGKYGWTQGAFYDSMFRTHKVAASHLVNPPACALGALAKALGDTCVITDSVIEEDFMVSLPGTPYKIPIHEFNDREGTTAEDVISVLKELGSS